MSATIMDILRLMCEIKSGCHRISRDCLLENHALERVDKGRKISPLHLIDDEILKSRMTVVDELWFYATGQC